MEVDFKNDRWPTITTYQIITPQISALRGTWVCVKMWDIQMDDHPSLKNCHIPHVQTNSLMFSGEDKVFEGKSPGMVMCRAPLGSSSWTRCCRTIS